MVYHFGDDFGEVVRREKAQAGGLKSIGLEANPEYFAMALKAIPQLAAYVPNGDSGNGSKR